MLKMRSALPNGHQWLPDDYKLPKDLLEEDDLKEKKMKRLKTRIEKLSIDSFAEDESKARKIDRKSCLTKNLDQSQWKELRKQLKAESEDKRLLVLRWLSGECTSKIT